MKTRRSIATAIVFTALAFAAEREEKEVKVKMRDLPEAVRRTVLDQSKGASLRGLTKEVEDGKTYYEAELKVAGHTRDVLIDTAGAIVTVEEEVPRSALPAAARETLQKAIAGGKLLTLESISRNNTITAYEAHVRNAGKTSEIKVTPGGKLVEQ